MTFLSDELLRRIRTPEGMEEIRRLMMAPTEDLLRRLQHLEDIEEIRKLYIAYGRHLDDGDAAAYASLFSADAKLRLGGVMRADGCEEIEKVAALVVRPKEGSIRRTLHLIASPVIEVEGDRAKGECVWAAVSADEGQTPDIPHMGRHVDEFVREEGRWRIAFRKGLLDLGRIG